MKYTKYLAILAAAFMMGSCSDDFLDKEPSENASEDQIKDLLDKDPTAIQAYAQRGELEKCAEESFDCVSCGCCSVRCPAGISHPMVGLLARRLTGKYIAPKSEHLEKRVEEIHEGKYDDLIEQIMQKPITDMQELYNNREIEK